MFFNVLTLTITLLLAFSIAFPLDFTNADYDTTYEITGREEARIRFERTMASQGHSLCEGRIVECS